MGGFGVRSSNPGDVLPPTVPTGVTATKTGEQQVTVTWNASSDVNGVAGYRVTRAGSQDHQSISSVATRAAVFNGLAQGQSHTFEVRSIDTYGNESAPAISSPVIVQETAPTTAGFAPSSASYSVNAPNGFVDRAVITVSKQGGGFGTGPSQVLFDSFDGTPGSDVSLTATKGSWSSFGTYRPKVSDEAAHSGSTSALVSYEASSSTRIAKYLFQPATEFFVSFWMRSTVADSQIVSGQAKLNWIMDGDSGFSSSGFDLCSPTWSSGWAVGGNSNQWTWGGDFGSFMPANEWIRWASWGKSNGASPQTYWLQGIGATNGQRVRNVVTREQTFFGSSASTSFNQINVPGYLNLYRDLTPDGTRKMWYDDVYIAVGTNSAARFEVGEAATYSSCKELSICPHQGWSDSQVSISLLLGGHSTFTNKYLYWIDANNVPTLLGQFVSFVAQSGYSATGSFADGSTVVLSKIGGGFGTKLGNPSTRFFDRVDKYCLDGQWVNTFGGSPDGMRYDAAAAAIGPYAGYWPNVYIDKTMKFGAHSTYRLAPWSGEYIQGFDKWKPWLDGFHVGKGKLFVSWRYRNVVRPANSSTSCKFLRTWDTNDSLEISYRVSWTYYHFAGNGVLNYERSDPKLSEFNLFEVYHDVNLVTGDWAASRWLNGTQKGGISGNIADIASPGVTPRLIGFDPAGGTWETHWVAYNPDGTFGPAGGAYDYMPVHLADIYADCTPQRVEICNSGVSPYQATERDCQIIKNWTNDAITIEVNQGGQTALSGRYVWWYDANNTPTLIGRIP